MENELVSIVLPVHNGEKYLRTAIDSILNQTYKNIELIVVNDFSNDSSEEIVKEYISRDKRVNLINNEINLKLPASLNAGFRSANGKYLTWTSDDNILYPEMVERMIRELGKGCSFVYADVDYIGEDGKLLNAQNVHGDDIWVENVVGASFMYTREVYDTVGDYDTTAFLVEDYDYWIRVSMRYELRHLHEKLYAYRHHENSLTTSRKNDVLRATIKQLNKYLECDSVDGVNKDKIMLQFAAYYYELNDQKAERRILERLRKSNVNSYRNIDLTIRLFRLLPKWVIEAMRKLH